MPQNLLNIGIDIPKLEAQKAEAVAIIKSLFAELSKFDNTKISPLNLTGLTQLNSAVAQTNAQFSTLRATLAEVVGLMSQFNAANKSAGTSNVTSGGGSSKAKQTQEEKDWIAMMKQANVEAEAISRKQIQMEKREAAEVIAAEKAKTKARKEAAAEKKRLDKESEQADTKRIANEKKVASEKKKADDASIASSKKKQKSDQEEAKNALLLSNEYKQLLQRQKDLKESQANLILTGNKGTDAYKQVTKDLEEVSNVINKVKKETDSATSGGGILKFSKFLTEGLSSLRTLAYILPGIGIAGIFNLAFEAIGGLFDGLGKTTQRVIDMNDAAKDLNATLKEQADIIERLRGSQSRYANVGINDQANLNQAFGQSPIANANDQLEVLKKQFDEAKRAADVAGLFPEDGMEDAGLYDTKNQIAKSKANLDIINDIIDAVKQLKGLGYDVFKTSDLRQVQEFNNTDPLADPIIKKTSELNARIKPLFEGNNAFKFGDVPFKSLDALQSIADKQKSDVDLAQTKLDKSLDIYEKYLDSKNALDTKQKEIEKIAYDDERKQRAETEKQNAEAVIAANQLILDNTLKTTAERIAATKAIAEAQKTIAASDDFLIQSDREASTADKRLSARNLPKIIAALTKKANQDSIQLQADFDQKKQQALENATQDEITLDQLKNEQQFKNEQQSYYGRFQALEKYIADRKAAINEYYLFEKKRLEETTPKDLLPAKMEELNNSIKKQQFEVTQNTQAEVASIVDSYYKAQIKFITDSYNNQLYVSKAKETEELRILNESYAKKNISYRKFAKEKKEIQQKYLVELDKEEIERDVDAVNRLVSLRKDLDTKIGLAQDKFANAQTEPEAQAAGAELASLIKDREELNNKIQDKEQEVQNDRLKLEKDTNKEVEESRRQLAVNLGRIQKELFDLIKQIGDEEYEEDLRREQEKNARIQKNADAEIDAIERSTLAEKDKNAYEVQLQAQKAAADEEASRKEKKIRHDKAVFDREVDIAQIVTNTSLAIAGMLTHSKELGPLAIPLAITTGAIGAIALAKALTTNIPAYAEGGIHKKDGLALYGEAGNEWVKEPFKKPYLVTEPTVGFLKSGTELVPESKVISMYEQPDNSWAQTMYLGRMISKNNKQIRNVFKPKINVDLGLELYKQKILHG